MTDVLEKLYELNVRMERVEKLTLLKAKEVLSLQEAAMLMGCSDDHVYRLSGGPNPVLGFSQPNGKNKFFEKKEILAYMRRNRVKGQIEIEEEAENF